MVQISENLQYVSFHIFNYSNITNIVYMPDIAITVFILMSQRHFSVDRVFMDCVVLRK